MSDKVQDYLDAGKRLEEAATPGPTRPVYYDCKTHNEIENLVERFREHFRSGEMFFYGVEAPAGKEHEKYADDGYDLNRGVTVAWTGNGPQSAANALLISDARTRLPRYRRAIEAVLEITHSDRPMNANTSDAGWNNALILVSNIVARALLGEESA